MPKLRNLQGMKFGRLTAIYRDTNAKNGRVRWFCRCECGGTKTAYAKTLLNNDISNLRLMGHGEHTTLHNKERHQRRLECQVA